MTVDSSRLRFGILVFGDVSALLRAPAKPHTNFSIGAIGLRVNANLGDHVDALAEIAFESIVDVEQLALAYRTPRWILQVGRMHSEIGYWNTAYHHGTWLQPLVKRPHAIRFEDDGGLVPVHWIGLHLTHRIPVRDGEVALIAGLGNGRGEIVDDILSDGDVNEAKGALLKVAYRRHGAYRLDVGASAMIDRIPSATMEVRPARPGKSIDELMANVYAFYRGDTFSLHTEGFLFLHRADGRRVSTSMFAVGGYRVTEILTVLGGVDLVFVDEKDPFFVPDPMTAGYEDVKQLLLGARYELGTWSAVKLEGHADLHSNADTQYTLTANWSFGI